MFYYNVDYKLCVYSISSIFNFFGQGLSDGDFFIMKIRRTAGTKKNIGVKRTKSYKLIIIKV